MKQIYSLGAFLFAIAIGSAPVYADDHGHHSGAHNEGHHHQGHASGEHMMNADEMHDGAMTSHMREVMGSGRINKIMADRHMVNIKHEPMPEMNWPKMSMNFNTKKTVDLGALRPGQEVEFKLLVDDDNNYVIKEITVK